MSADLVGNIVLMSNDSETGINIRGNATSVVANKLVDTGWNFTTAGVTVGDTVINVETGSTATLDAIDSATTLSLSADIMKTTGDEYLITDSATVVVVYVEHMDEVSNKILKIIKAAQSSGNWDEGPKDTSILDLLRVEFRYSVRGFIASSDKSGFNSLFKKGGVFNMTWDGDNHDVNIDKLSIAKSAKFGEQDERRVIFTVIEGVDTA